MKHFVTLYPEAENVHLVKDVGQIPYQMQKHFGYTSTLVCWKNSDRYPYLDKEVKGLNIEFIENKRRTFFWSNSAISYIWRNARSIDVLNVYFLVQESMLYGLIYKYRNPDGVLYLKMDMDINHYKKVGIKFSDNELKNQVHFKMYEFFLKQVDLVSVETDRSFSLLQQLDERLTAKTIKIQNGLDFGEGWGRLDDSLFAQKENIIISVGRIGSEAKNNEFMLNALESMDLRGWKVYFVGPITPEFRPQIDTFFKANPALKEHVFFTGNIEDREELLDYYKRAKIFCLTSKWEAFPLVLLEALCAGNYIIGTDRITSIEEMTRNGEIGNIIEYNAVRELRKALTKAIEPGFYTQKLMREIMTFGRQFEWRQILKKLDANINRCMNR